jgi:DNA integrity scanning protein DisA with diadenylate cyclase activity
VKLAVLIALTRKLLQPRDTILCLSGPTESGELDTLVVMRPDREFEMFLMPQAGEEMAPGVSGEVLERVITIAAELATEGREGRPVGALFVLGDTAEVSELSRQLVLNPFAGYSSKERNILDPALDETVKEYAAIDGAFLIWDDGVLESAGTYVKTASQAEYTLPQGLGARHQAAAAITAVTKALAVTVSQSTGTVTIFRRGAIVTEIEKPRQRVRTNVLDSVHSEEGLEP